MALAIYVSLYISISYVEGFFHWTNERLCSQILELTVFMQTKKGNPSCLGYSIFPKLPLWLVNGKPRSGLPLLKMMSWLGRGKGTKITISNNKQKQNGVG